MRVACQRRPGVAQPNLDLVTVASKRIYNFNADFPFRKFSSAGVERRERVGVV